MTNAYTLVKPTSVVANGGGSSASIGANGKITLSTCTSININGCFTSTYDLYYVLWRGTGTEDNTIRVRLRAAGTDRSTSTYDFQGFDIDSNGSAFRSINQTEARLGPTATTHGSFEAWFVNPALASRTAIRCRGVVDLSTVHYVLWYHAQQVDSDAFDGMTLYPSGGSISGTFLIYGLTK